MSTQEEVNRLRELADNWYEYEYHRRHLKILLSRIDELEAENERLKSGVVVKPPWNNRDEFLQWLRDTNRYLFPEEFEEETLLLQDVAETAISEAQQLKGQDDGESADKRRPGRRGLGQVSADQGDAAGRC